MYSSSADYSVRAMQRFRVQTARDLEFQHPELPRSTSLQKSSSDDSKPKQKHKAEAPTSGEEKKNKKKKQQQEEKDRDSSDDSKPQQKKRKQRFYREVLAMWHALKIGLKLLMNCALWNMLLQTNFTWQQFGYCQKS